MTEKPHPGISMHKLPVGDGFAGLVFALGSALIFLFGLPALWYFVAFAFGLGVGIAILLRLINRSRSERNKPLSILTAPQAGKTPVPEETEVRRNLFQVFPKPVSA